MADGYYLTDEDRRLIASLRQLQTKSGGQAVGPVIEDRPYIGRVKTGTSITPLTVAPDVSGVVNDDKYTPGKGTLVLWSPRLVLVDDDDSPAVGGMTAKKVLACMRKLSKLTAEHADLDAVLASVANDIEVTVYNYTPFEVFDITWVEAKPTRDGMLAIAAPPPTHLIAKKPSGSLASMKGYACEIGYLDPAIREANTTTSVTWLRDTADQPITRVCFNVSPYPITGAAGARMMVRVDPFGALIIDTVFC